MDKPLLLNNKKYISARNAAKIFGYSQDYVGQLCRSKKIESTRVGHIWFVAEQDLITYRQNFSTRHIKKSRISPDLRKSRKIENGCVSVKLDVSSFSHKYLSGVNFVDFSKKIRYSNLSYENDFSPLFPLIPEKGNLDQYVGRQNILQNIYYRGLATAFALLIFVISGIVFTHNASNFYNDITVINTANVLNVEIKKIIPIDKIYDFGNSVVNKARLVFIRLIFGNNLAVQVQDNNSVFSGNSVNPVSPASNDNNQFSQSVDSRGVVVLPFEENEKERQGYTNHIKNSFSDEVEIKVDRDGVSGTITPVFRETKGDDYLYVLVPLKE